MCSVEKLLFESKISNQVTIEATVDTGFEMIAERECRDKLGAKVLLHRSRGRVCFNIPLEQCPMVYIYVM